MTRITNVYRVIRKWAMRGSNPRPHGCDARPGTVGAVNLSQTIPVCFAPLQLVFRACVRAIVRYMCACTAAGKCGKRAVERLRCTPKSGAADTAIRGAHWKLAKGLESDSIQRIAGDNEQFSRDGAAKASVTVSPPVPADTDLRTIIDAWSFLPESIKIGIVAMVAAATRRR